MADEPQRASRSGRRCGTVFFLSAFVLLVLYRRPTAQWRPRSTGRPPAVRPAV